MYIRGIDRIVRFSGLQKALVDIYGPNFAINLYNHKLQNIQIAAVMENFDHCRGRTVLGALDGTA
jgi:hypothetical protein